MEFQECRLCRVNGKEEPATRTITIGCVSISYCSYHFDCVTGVLNHSKKWDMVRDKVW